MFSSKNLQREMIRQPNATQKADNTRKILTAWLEAAQEFTSGKDTFVTFTVATLNAAALICDYGVFYEAFKTDAQILRNSFDMAFTAAELAHAQGADEMRRFFEKTLLTHDPVKHCTGYTRSFRQYVDLCAERLFKAATVFEVPTAAGVHKTAVSRCIQAARRAILAPEVA